MTWHKWLVRGLVFLVVGAVALAGSLYALWTNPAVIRQVVQDKLGVRFIDVAVQVGSARLRLLGGILVHELRLARNNGLDRRDFLYVPSAVIYHDKEHVLDGKVAIRKMELTRPQLRIVRERDGRLNVTGLLGPVDLRERVPTVVVRDGTLVFEDQVARPGTTLLEIRNVQMSLLNDPLPTLQIEGSGQSDVLGPIRFRATVPRATLAAHVEIALPTIPVGPPLWQSIGSLCPTTGSNLAQFSGLADVGVTLDLPESPGGKITHDVRLNLDQGRCQHPRLPRLLDHVKVSARLTNGVIPRAKMTASLGSARVEVSLADLRLPERNPTPEEFEKNLGELDVRVEQLPIDDEVLNRLPAHLQSIKDEYSPAGPLTVAYRYRRGTTTSGLVKRWTLEPQGMTGSFVNFAYPVRNIRGTVSLDVARLPAQDIRIDLAGLAGDQPITLRGSVRGPRNTSEVILDITGRDILLDDAIFRALPDGARKVASQFLPGPSRKHGLGSYPMGRADVLTSLRRDLGEEQLSKVYTITFKQSAVQYDQFPLPLDNVSGTLVIHPDHWECINFQGSHAGGELHVDGRSHRLPGRGVASRGDPGEPAPLQRVEVRIRGKDLPLGREFEQALVPTSGNERQPLQAAWKRMRLAGRLSFSAEVIDHPGQPQDIDVTVNVQGCTMKPTFFDYALDQLSGSVRYERGRLHLRNMVARHGGASLGLHSGLIQMGAEGGFTAWLQGLTGQGIVVDADLLQAMPEGLRQALEGIQLRTPVAAAAKLTLHAPSGPAKPLEVWWEGAVALDQAKFRTGIDVTDACGQLYCKGYHDGRRLRGVNGQLALEKASVLGQPLTRVNARLDVEPGSPDVLRIRDLKASIHGGTIAGQARLETAPILRYEVLLEALGVQLDQVGRHNLGPAAKQAQLEGPARAALHLTGEGNDLLGLKGNGRLDVLQGKMGQLPVLLDLVKAFGLRVPDRTAFDQACMLFAIEGPQIRVQQLDLFGNAISLRGQGALDLDGSNVELDFTATPGRVIQMLPTGFDEIPQVISSQFLKIKMRGKVGKAGTIRFDKELIPAVVEPLRRVMGGT